MKSILNDNEDIKIDHEPKVNSIPKIVKLKKNPCSTLENRLEESLEKI